MWPINSNPASFSKQQKSSDEYLVWPLNVLALAVWWNRKFVCSENAKTLVLHFRSLSLSTTNERHVCVYANGASLSYLHIHGDKRRTRLAYATLRCLVCEEHFPTAFRPSSLHHSDSSTEYIYRHHLGAVFPCRHFRFVAICCHRSPQTIKCGEIMDEIFCTQTILYLLQMEQSEKKFG